MTKIKILCVGKIKEPFFRDALREYEKRLRAFCDLEIVEVKDEPLTPSVGLKTVIKRESDRLLSKMTDGYFIALEPYGKQVDSNGLAKLLDEHLRFGEPVCFIVGGSHGLSDELIKKSNLTLSFSKLTFPHQLFRVMLAEQIYRSFTILSGRKYHK